MDNKILIFNHDQIEFLENNQAKIKEGEKPLLIIDSLIERKKFDEWMSRENKSSK